MYLYKVVTISSAGQTTELMLVAASVQHVADHVTTLPGSVEISSITRQMSVQVLP